MNIDKLTWEIILGVPVAVVALFILVRVVFTGIFISYWKVRVWWHRELIKQIQKEKEEEENGNGRP